MKNIDILHATPKTALEYFLREDSYFSSDLPSYIEFKPLLEILNKTIKSQNINENYTTTAPDLLDGVNHKILVNKDGKYSWRPLQLIHPFLYVELAKYITSPENWKFILSTIAKLNSDTKNLTCASWPIISGPQEKNRANQIIEWSSKVQNQSIKLSLDYDYLFRTDVTDCYGSIYTHTISWSLHTKEQSKQNRAKKIKDKTIGDNIDYRVRCMSWGQTIGIPQGSTLMDFIVEIIFAYADKLLSDKLIKLELTDFRIIRYRDDYRIFVNNPRTAEYILKEITEVLNDFGLKINSQKTEYSDDVVHSSIKKDKLNRIKFGNSYQDFVCELLAISIFSRENINSPTTQVWLQQFYENNLLDLINTTRNKKRLMISIVIDIAFHTPRAYPIIFATISLLLDGFPNKTKQNIIYKIIKKFNKMPNIGIMQIWLQRLIIKLSFEHDFSEKTCNKIYNPTIPLWESGWINSKKIVETIDNFDIVNRDKLNSLDEIITSEEVALFTPYYYES